MRGKEWGGGNGMMIRIHKKRTLRERKKKEGFLDMKGVGGELRFDSLVLVDVIHHRDGLGRAHCKILTEFLTSFSSLTDVK